MEHREVVLDHGGLADDDGRGMVEQDALADAGTGVDVDGEHLGDAALQVQRQRLPAAQPVVVRHPVRLQGVEPLEVQQRHRVAQAGRVAAEHRPQVFAERRTDARIGPERVVDQRAVETLVREHHGVQIAGQRRLALGGRGGLRADASPDLVVRHGVPFGVEAECLVDASTQS